MTSRGWAFTSFKEVEPKWNESVMKYMIYQREKCPSTGREHWQGYVKFKSPVRRKGAQLSIGDDVAHMEASKGDETSNINYCSKSTTKIGEVIQHGTPTVQGQRTDLQNYAKAVTDLSKQINDIILDNPTLAIKYPRGTQLLRSTALNKAASKIRPDIEVHVLIGAPGSGKTRTVYDSYPLNDIYKITLDSQSVWWDGYDGQNILLIDDFESWLPYRFLLNVLDIYPLRLPIKGGYTYANWGKVYITSNRPLEQWYPGQRDKDALYRRIKVCHKVSRSGGVILCPPPISPTEYILDETVKLE